MNALRSKGLDFRDLDNLKLFSDTVKRSTRTIQGWLYENRVPNPSIWKQLELLLDKPIFTLFPQLAQRPNEQNLSLVEGMKKAGFDPNYPERIQKFAQVVGCTPHTVKLWIYKGLLPRVALAERISIVLNKPASELFPNQTKKTD